MKTILTTALVGVLLAGSPAPVQGTTGRFEALFCPECWEYLQGPGALDRTGNCAACGKYPVEVDATAMTWWWCGREKKWRRSACPVHWMKRCCVAEESLAIKAAPGPEVFEAWYCPSHRSFYVYRLPVLSQWVCRTCAKPAVKVDATERAWYWCAIDGVWGARPCSQNYEKKCCVRRAGVLLVKAEPGPLAQ